MEHPTPDFESIKQVSPYEAEYWSARDLAPLLGYAKWQNFEGLVRRAQNLIRTGAVSGGIVESRRKVTIGRGGIRQVLDYELDRDAVNLLKDLASSYKLTKYYSIRNETVLLGLLEKYCNLKGISFRFQKELGDHVFDCLVADYITVEFDEIHHEYRRQRQRDARKRAFAESLGLVVVEFHLSDDIVDIIVEIDRQLALRQTTTCSC